MIFNGHQRIDSNDSVDPLTFPLMPHFLVKGGTNIFGAQRMNSGDSGDHLN